MSAACFIKRLSSLSEPTVKLAHMILACDPTCELDASARRSLACTVLGMSPDELDRALAELREKSFGYYVDGVGW